MTGSLGTTRAILESSGPQVTVVGGGYIGLETAAAASLWGFDITVIFPESRFMERLFTPEIADFYEDFYAKKGITVKKGVLAVAFEGQGGKARILLSACNKLGKSEVGRQASSARKSSAT